MRKKIETIVKYVYTAGLNGGLDFPQPPQVKGPEVIKDATDAILEVVREWAKDHLLSEEKNENTVSS